MPPPCGWVTCPRLHFHDHGSDCHQEEPSRAKQSHISICLINICICVIVHHAVLIQRSRSSRLLNSEPLSLVGTLSYSLYLWQQPFLNRSGSSILQAFPLNLALAVACGMASFYLIEKPMLRLRTRFLANSDEAPQRPR